MFVTKFGQPLSFFGRKNIETASDSIQNNQNLWQRVPNVKTGFYVSIGLLQGGLKNVNLRSVKLQIQEKEKRILRDFSGFVLW